MKKSQIAEIRLINQQITATNFRTPEEIVSWFGAVQAQDYSMAKWAIGLRLPGSTELTIETAVEKGTILRTHILRPTWHFVAAEDIRWMLELTAARIRSSSASMFRQLELDHTTLRKSNRVIAKALDRGNHLTRQELHVDLEKAGLITGDMRMTCFVFNAELDGIICSGARRGKQQTYALLDERAPKTVVLSREESIAELARRYFTSHGPATLKDFVWWSGLSVADAKKGLEMNKSNLVSEKIEEQTYWMSHSVTVPNRKRPSLHLLPAFDEFTVSYKDRSASVADELLKVVAVGHAIFRPIIVVDGRVVGIWKRTLERSTTRIEHTFFEDLKHSRHSALAKATKQYAKFEGKTVR